jgi:hypothetical protein
MEACGCGAGGVSECFFVSAKAREVRKTNTRRQTFRQIMEMDSPKAAHHTEAGGGSLLVSVRGIFA